MEPFDVLNIFVEQHRLCSPLDPEADPSAVLSFNSTIDDWRMANDLLQWRKLSDYLSTEFDIKVEYEVWQSVLTPPSNHTLLEVCQLISKFSNHNEIKPIKLLGKECLSSAVFSTLKKYLERRNVDVTDLKPSTIVTPYFEKYFSQMLEQITIVANGKKLFDHITIKRKKTGFINYLNIFDKDRYTILIGDIKTFRDLTLKIIEVNELAL